MALIKKTEMRGLPPVHISDPRPLAEITVLCKIKIAVGRRPRAGRRADGGENGLTAFRA
jgi:hypothetical protein